MNRRLNSIAFLFLLLLNLSAFAQLTVKPSDKNIQYQGRILMSTDSASMFWPGSSATLHFKGTGVAVSMKSLLDVGHFYVIVDNDASKELRIASNFDKQTITLAQNLADGEHTLQIFKLSNCTSENRIYSFQILGNAQLLTPASALPARKIEFYGNSITCGHGVDRPAGMIDSGSSEHFNNYYSYAAVTARHFNAQYSCIARSGIGIMLSWFPEIMPEVYNRTNPADPASRWDFSAYTPDIVVINLFQNDSWLVNRPEHEQFKARFGTIKPSDDFIIKSYRDFVSSIRSKYPKAHIICALGNMDATREGSQWPGYIQKAVTSLKDKKMYTVFFPYKNTGGHPTRAEEQMMADDLIGFIEKNIKW
jgi:hypothetical protein